MNIRHYILTLIFAAVSIAAGAQKIYVNGYDASDPNNPISQGIDSVNVDNVKFQEPAVIVQNDQGTQLNRLYTFKYYIYGQEDNIKQMKSPLGTTSADVDMSYDDANKWYIEVNNGQFFTGNYSGTATIHVQATPNEGAGSTLDGYYKVVVEPLPTTVTVYPTNVTVYKNFKFQLPTAKIKFGSNDITSYFNSNRKLPEDFVADQSDKEIVTCSTPGTYEITWDFIGNTVDGMDYSRHYAEAKDTVKVTVLDATRPSSKLPVTMTWEGAATQTIPKNNDNTFNTITLPYPNVTVTVNKHAVLMNKLFRYKYEIVSAEGEDGTTKINPTLTTPDNGITWNLTPDALGTITLKVTNMDLNLDEQGNLQAPTDFGQATETYVVYVADQIVTVTLNPDEATIPGSWVITNQIWNLPKYSATRDNKDFTSSATWFIGLPDGTATTFDDDPDLAGGEQRTVDGVLYQFYPIIREFADGDTIDMTDVPIDNRNFMFWAKPTDTSLGDGGFLAQTLTYTDLLKPVLTPTYNYIVANIKEGDNKEWALLSLHTPNLKITSSTGADISEFYNISYHLDKDAQAAGFSIDNRTGQISYSYTGDEPNTDVRTITYIVTPKTTPTIYAIDSTTVTIHTAKATYSYEVLTSKGEKYGKLHFTGEGSMASGTRINAVPGLDIMFGAIGGNPWTVQKTTDEYKDTQDGYSDKDVLITDGGQATIGKDSIPTKGTYYVLFPYTSGKVTIDANFEAGATYALIGSNGYKETFEGTDNFSNEKTMSNVLVAGVTYYLYCFSRNPSKTAENGLDDGELHLHGINFKPCYITSQSDTEPTTKGTIFINSNSTSNAAIISSPSPGVKFAIKNDGIDYTPYVRVNAETGVVTGRSNSRMLKTGRVPIVAIITNDELGDQLIDTAEIDLLVTSIPSYVVTNGKLFDIGDELHPSITENGITTENTDVTFTIGGWKGSYLRSNRSYTDAFNNPAGTDESGDNGGIIDGFRYRASQNNNPYDENFKSFTYNTPNGQHSSFETPVYGAYYKVEAKKTGTVNVYICQNGLVDYAGTDLEMIKNRQPQQTQIKWRPMFITDETGNSIPLTATTNSTLKVAYNDMRVRNYALNNPYANTEKALFLSNFVNETDPDYDPAFSECAFSWYRFNGTGENKNRYTVDEAKKIVLAWKDMTVGQKEKVFKLQQGYAIISKGFVRYTFRVYPGKSYYIYMSGSKAGLAGFTYLPDEYLTDTRVTPPTIDMNDYADEAKTSPVTAKDFYDAVTSKVDQESATDTTLYIYPGFDVNIKRKFATDKWTSICLPFSLTEDQFESAFGKNALIMTYSSIDPIKDSNNRFVVRLVQHARHMIEANRPYFIRPSKTMSDDANVGVTINGVTIQSNYGKLPSAKGELSSDGNLIISDQKNGSDVVNASGHTQVGTLTEVTAPAKSFIMAGTRLYHTATEYKVPPFRSFIIPNGTSTTSGAKPVTFDIEIYDAASKTYLDIDNTPTGIDDIEANGVDEQEHAHVIHGVFNLAGQKVAESITDRLPRGVYIVEGKKVIVR